MTQVLVMIAKELCGSADFYLFVPGNTGGCAAELVVATIADFDKYQYVFLQAGMILHYQVDFSCFAAEVPRQQLQSLQTQVVDRQCFSPLTTSLCRWHR